MKSLSTSLYYYLLEVLKKIKPDLTEDDKNEIRKAAEEVVKIYKP